MSFARAGVGLEVSLGKNWLCSGGTAADKMFTRKEPALCNFLINSKGTPLLIFSGFQLLYSKESMFVGSLVAVRKEFDVEILFFGNYWSFQWK